MMTPQEIRQECEDELCPAWAGTLTRNQVWRLAWEHGHASGASDIKFYYDEFMDVARATREDATA